MRLLIFLPKTMIETILMQSLSTMFFSLALFIPLDRLSEITKDYKGVSTFFKCLAYLMTYMFELGLIYLVVGMIVVVIKRQC